MTYILAVDPGKMTGLALVDWDREAGLEPTLIWANELEFNAACNLINSVLSNFEDVDTVVERFLITPQTGKNSQAGWSLEVIGVTRWLVDSYGHREIILQTPQRAKSFVDNKRLRALGMWYRGGKGHALDALRHVVVHLVDLGWRPEELLTE